jgi:putative Mg2+ transporter-C (MgtC) family protein
MIGLPEFLLRAAVAVALGLVVGLDREIKHKPLGARAYMLVALGASGMMMVTLNFSLSAVAQDPALSIDPTRLIQGIVGGIGFLGAGAILSRRDSGRVRGVGSGAAIRAVGGIGIGCGLGYLAEAAILALLALAILAGADWLESRGSG